MKNKIEYDGNKNETYSLLLNQVFAAELLLSEDGAMEITKDIQKFIDNDQKERIIEIKNDDDKLGAIVDIWDKGLAELADTCCFWFDDYRD